MTSELTSEEIVTKLLTSNSIVKNTNISFFSSPVEYNLSNFIEDEQINDNNYKSEYFPTKASYSKYAFIKKKDV